MMMNTRVTVLLSSLLLAACASHPPPPDWQLSSQSALKLALSAYFAGDNRVAELEFTRVRNEVASTGKLDLLARAELVRCAAQVASLDLGPCANYQALATDAAPPERAYAAFLAGQGSTADAALLPKHYQALAGAAAGAANVETLKTVADPLSRLVAAAVLFRKGQLPPEGIQLATDTASDQGWRRPLLAWLGVQAELASKAGNEVEAQRIKRRIALVSGQP
jgi:hypothetical protein